MKKSIKEGSMSDIDLMAQEAVSFKDFVKEFYKEFRDFPKNRDAMKWLEDTYKSVSEGTESDELERVADALPQTVEEMINEVSLSSAGVKNFLRALYRNTNIIKKLGFSNFKGVIDYIQSNGIRDWDDLRDEATGFGLKFESVNESKKMFSVHSHSAGSKKLNIDVYDGRKNKDGSPFIGTVTANHSLELKDKIQAYKSKGYTQVDNVGKKLGIKYKTESVNEEKPGLWANIRAKRARGEKPAHGNSDAHKDAVKAGKKINNEDHSGDPSDKYVVKPCKDPIEKWAVWEGDIRVKGFETQPEAQAFADMKNKEQGLTEVGDVIDTITMDIPLFIRTLEFAREDAKTDMDLHDFAERAIKLTKEKGTIDMSSYNELIGGSSVNEGAGCGCGCGCGGSKLTENTEPTIITQLKDIVKTSSNKVLVDPKSGKKVRVDLYSASAITKVYDALKQQSNKDKFVSTGLMGMQSMAFKLLK
jgi:hypothetical protein